MIADQCPIAAVHQLRAARRHRRAVPHQRRTGSSLRPPALASPGWRRWRFGRAGCARPPAIRTPTWTATRATLAGVRARRGRAAHRRRVRRELHRPGGRDRLLVRERHRRQRRLSSGVRHQRRTDRLRGVVRDAVRTARATYANTPVATRQGLRHARDARPTRPRRALKVGGAAPRGRLAQARRHADLRRDRQLRDPRGPARHAGPQSPRRTRPCDYHLAAPCAGRRSSTLRVPDGTPDGTHAARIVARGRRPATRPPCARTISVDGTPPTRDPRARARPNDRALA